MEVAEPGWQEVAWCGVDGHGRRVASGVHFAHVQQGGVYGVVRVVMVK